VNFLIHDAFQQMNLSKKIGASLEVLLAHFQLRGPNSHRAVTLTVAVIAGLTGAMYVITTRPWNGWPVNTGPMRRVGSN